MQLSLLTAVILVSKMSLCSYWFLINEGVGAAAVEWSLIVVVVVVVL